MRTTFIYALKEPDTGEIRYIGKSDDPKQRFYVHLADKSKNHRTDWIRSLSKPPILEIVDEVPYEFWQQLEIAYIEFFQDAGCDLVNGTLGGDWVEQTPEVRAKISAALAGRVGKKLSPETRAKMSASRLGKKRSPETCAKMSASQVGKTLSLDHRIKLSMGWEKKRQESYLAEMWR